jgi:hypothetical protein
MRFIAITRPAELAPAPETVPVTTKFPATVMLPVLDIVRLPVVARLVAVIVLATRLPPLNIEDDMKSVMTIFIDQMIRYTSRIL